MRHPGIPIFDVMLLIEVELCEMMNVQKVFWHVWGVSQLGSTEKVAFVNIIVQHS